MDAAGLTSAVKQLNEANAGGKTEDIIQLLKKLKGVEPTEELLRTSRAGIAVGKLRQHATPGVSALAKEIVKKWKDAVEESKRKRKRAEDEASSGDVKRVRGEGGSGSGAASPAGSSGKRSDKDAKDGKSKDEGKDGKGKEDGKAKDEGKDDAKDKSKSKSPSAPPPLSTIDSSRKTPRTAKSDGVANSLRADDSAAAADAVRDKCVVMIYDALAADSNAQTKVLSERAVSIEYEAFKLMNYSSGNDYRGKIRSLFLNLKDKGNPGLRNEIVLGNTEASRVVRMSKEEMANDSVRAMNEKLQEHNLFKAKAVGQIQQETDTFKCSRCKKRKCTYYQMQTRSADEPMTTFVKCTVCGFQWAFS